jgi:hypothetical protein
MPPRRTALIAVLVLSLAALGYAPAPRFKAKVPPGLAVGKWRVVFDNGVVEQCEVKKDGTMSVVEPLRSSSGKVLAKGSAFVIHCKDDRTERWTPAGGRMVVEHWCPSSEFPAGKPVLGVAAPAR